MAPQEATAADLPVPMVLPLPAPPTVPDRTVAPPAPMDPAFVVPLLPTVPEPRSVPAALALLIDPLVSVDLLPLTEPAVPSALVAQAALSEFVAPSAPVILTHPTLPLVSVLPTDLKDP